MSDIELEQSTTKKKRTKTDELHGRNKIKKALVKGECYTNYKSMSVPVKQPDCGRKKCTEKNVLDLL